MEFYLAKNGILHIGIKDNKCDYCGCCVGVCPDDAIELKESSIRIINENCTNCSKCIWSCPIEVLYFDRVGIKKND